MVDQPSEIKTKVRDLISAYEKQSRAEPTLVANARPRAKSIGNVLSHKFFYRPKVEIHDISDLEKELVKFDAHLNYYEVYNKQKHVAFQEQLFNILTGIVNIDSAGNENISLKKKELIAETQRLVSILNFKLPVDTQVNGTVSVAKNTTPEKPFKYTPYSSYVKSKEETDTRKYGAYSENTVVSQNGSDDVDSFKLTSVSNLMKHFQTKQPQEEIKIVKPKEQEVIVEASPVEIVRNVKENVVESHVENGDNSREKMSVSKLKNLFEEKNKRNSQGLEVIVKNPFMPTFAGSETSPLPFTERNLGNIRLHRAISGNYMSYSGLLHSTDINRSKSTNDLNHNLENGHNRENGNASEDESVTESDETLGDEEEIVHQSVAEVVEQPVSYSTLSFANGSNSDNKMEELKISPGSDEQDSAEENNNEKETESNGGISSGDEFFSDGDNIENVEEEFAKLVEA